MASYYSCERCGLYVSYFDLDRIGKYHKVGDLPRRAISAESQMAPSYREGLGL